MKQAIRSEFPETTQRELDGSRYALLVENKWAPPTVICHGNDPVAVSQNNTPVEYDGPQRYSETDGKPLPRKPKAPHVFNPKTNQIEWHEGVLHRIDEAKRCG